MTSGEPLQYEVCEAHTLSLKTSLMAPYQFLPETIAFKKKILRTMGFKQPELMRSAGCRAPELLPVYW
jgi:hypothetical protein